VFELLRLLDDVEPVVREIESYLPRQDAMEALKAKREETK
jgi:hypothetical protein